MRTGFGVISFVVLGTASMTAAQSSSLWRAPAPADQNSGQVAPRDGWTTFAARTPGDRVSFMTRAIEQASPIAVPLGEPRKFRPNDLITIIVRQQKDYQAKGKLDSKKEWDLTGKLTDWFRFYPNHHLGQDTLSNGEPGFAFQYENELKSRTKNNRSDRFTTRIQARVVDVKPNGNLVLEARSSEQHDEEEWTITLTGVCRSEDVTADNSILSTQVAELTIVETNHGAVRDGTRRGWIPKILDWLRPF